MNLIRPRTSGNRLRSIGASTLLAAVGLLAVSLPGAAGAAGAEAPPAPSPAAAPAPALQPVTSIPERPPGGATTPTGGPLLDHGGPVQTSPTLYVVFWDWTSDPNGEMPYLTRFLSSIGDSTWLTPLLQYGAGIVPTLAGTWSDSQAVPTAPSDAQIRAEAVRAAGHFGVSNTLNDQIIVATPTGHASPNTFAKGACSYHGFLGPLPNVTYIDFPYMTDDGATCGENTVNAGSAGVLDGVSIIAGHEVAESITDPLLNGWFDASGKEIADKCEWYDLTDVPAGSSKFAVQPLWSNLDNGCTPTWPGGWSPVAHAPGSTGNPPGLGQIGDNRVLGYQSKSTVSFDQASGATWTPLGAVVFQNGTHPATAIRPAVTVDTGNNAIYFAYTDASTGDVSVSGWEGGNKWTDPALAGQSSAGPGLCSLNGSQFVAFKDKTNDNVYLAVNSGSGFGTPLQIPGAVTSHNPAIVCNTSFPGAVVAWTTPAGKIQFVVAGLGISAVHTTPFTSPSGPALALGHTTLYLGWLTSSNQVDYASNANAEPVGTNWTSAQTQPTAVTTEQPTLSSNGGSLTIAWTGTSDGLNYSVTDF